MNPAIERNKKQRTNDVTSEKKPERRNPIAPLRAAEEFISDTFDTLQPAVANPLRESARKHVHAMSLVRNKNTQVEKMESHTLEKKFFHRSVRFAFEINVSKEASKSDAFEELQKEMEEKLLQTKQNFKGYVIRATRIKRDTMLEKI